MATENWVCLRPGVWPSSVTALWGRGRLVARQPTQRTSPDNGVHLSSVVPHNVIVSYRDLEAVILGGDDVVSVIF